MSVSTGTTIPIYVGWANEQPLFLFLTVPHGIPVGRDLLNRASKTLSEMAAEPDLSETDDEQPEPDAHAMLTNSSPLGTAREQSEGADGSI